MQFVHLYICIAFAYNSLYRISSVDIMTSPEVSKVFSKSNQHLLFLVSALARSSPMIRGLGFLLYVEVHNNWLRNRKPRFLGL